MSHVAAVVLGALTSTASLGVHRSGTPWLVLAMAASLGAAWVLRGTARPRLAASYSLAWVAVLGVAVAGRSEGDYLLAGDASGNALVVVAFVLVVLAVAALPKRHAPRT